MSEILSLIEEDKQPKRRNTSETGSRGERLAAGYLTEHGYRLVVANFSAAIGRNHNGAQINGEIDIVALDGDTLCFVEVKTRRTDEYADPLSNVDLRKQRVVTRTARVYRRIFSIRNIKHRFDVVTVVGENEPDIQLFKGYWTEAKFRKRAWAGDWM